MKYFWYSLIIFCLLLCSCRTQKLDSNVQFRSDIQSELSVMSESVKIDTTKTIHSEQISNIKIFKETITHTIYDTDKNVVKETTTTERSFVEDTKTDVAQEVQNGVEIHSQDSLNHFRESTQKVDADVKEESIGGQESFGKYFGITLGCVIGLLLIYLLVKYRVN